MREGGPHQLRADTRVCEERLARTLPNNSGRGPALAKADTLRWEAAAEKKTSRNKRRHA